MTAPSKYLWWKFLFVLSFAPLLAFGQQNVSVVAVDPPDRLTGAAVLGDWATDGVLDSWTGANVTGLAVTGGSLVGDDTSATTDGTVSRTAISGGPDLDLGFNDFLQIRIKLPAAYAGAVTIEYGTTVNTGFATTRKFTIPAATIVKDGAFHTYRLSLGLEVYWRDTLRDLRITPMTGSTGHFEIDYVEVGDSSTNDPEPALNLVTNFDTGTTVDNTTRLIGKHVCVWWENTNTAFTVTHARRAVRMCEESFQVYCNKLGYNRPFREFNSTTTPEYKINFISWYGGYWAGGYANRGHMNVDQSGLADEGWGNPVPHEFGHVVQMAQPGNLAGGHWESHANYLRAGRNLHFYPIINYVALDNLTANSNYHPDHKRHIYADQRYYVSLDDYGTQFGLPTNYAAVAWRDGVSGKTLVEKLAGSLPAGVSVKDVACESLKRWPMLDFVEKTKIRAQMWNSTDNKNRHLFFQGAQLVPLPDKAGWYRVPFERAPDCWAYQMHDLAAAAGSTITVELRGLDMPATTAEDWRWCLGAISPGDNIRYSGTFAPGTQSFTLNGNETNVFLIVTATPGTTPIDLESLSNTKPIDKDPDRLRYAYEVRLVNASPAPHAFAVTATGTPHSNGGGLVASTASVASTAYVGPNAKVLGTARVQNNARIEDFAVIQGSASVSNNAVVSGSALVEGSARIGENARIRDRAWVMGSSVVRGRALVGGYTQLENTTVQDDVIVRGCAHPFGGTLSGTAIADHDYSMDWTVSNGVQFSHIPWGGWWDAFYAQTVTKPRGLAASYRTEETGGEEWWDEFGAQHALLRGAPLRATDPTMGSPVVSFDGLNDYALFDRSVVDAPTFSFGCWVNPANPIGTAEPILFVGTNATRALKLVRNTAGKAVLTVSDGTTTATLTSTGVLPQNSWSHLAFTLSGTTGRLYVNGALQATTTTTLTPLTVIGANSYTTALACYLGRDFAGALFKGSFDDVRFYNVEMTAAEVRQECFRKGDIRGQFSPTAPTDFNGTNTIAQSGVRNGRVRTLEAWVKPRTSDAVGNYEAVFDSDDELSGRDGSGFGLNAGTWVVKVDGLGTWQTGLSATLNKWQHVALAFDGSTATLFINGKAASSKSYGGPVLDSDAAGKCYRIGFSQTSDNVATRQYFDGGILNARIHDRALTAAQLVLDSDGDGVNDSVEVDLGTNPLDPLSTPPTYPISGVVTNSVGAPIAGATVYFSEVPGAEANGTLRVTTDAAGAYSRSVLAGTWYVTATATAYNPGTERTVTVTTAAVPGINFTLAPSAVVSGKVTRQSDGAALGGATVYFAKTPDASSGAQFTTLTAADGTYSQPLTDGAWYVCAGAASFYTALDKSITVSGLNVTGIDFALKLGARTIPRGTNLLFGAITESLPNGGGTGAWPAYAPAGLSFPSIGNPSVASLGGVKWVLNNRITSNDGFQVYNLSANPVIPCNGVTIVAAARPIYCNPGGEARGEIVDIMYNRLALAVSHTDGRIMVAQNGFWAYYGPAIPDNTPVVISLVVQPNGSFVCYTNGVSVLTGGANGDFSTSMTPNGTETYKRYVNIGRNSPDGWSAYNGYIGDVFVYTNALSSAERATLENDLKAKFLSTDYLVTTSAGAGGYINPGGSVPVSPGGTQTISITPLAGYAITGVIVDGVARGPVSSWTFSNVTANHTVSATFALAPTFTVAKTDVTCFGGNNGSITVTAAGGSGSGYSFSSNNGSSFAAGNSPYTFANLAAGQYNLIVKDGAGTYSYTNVITLTQPATPVLADAGTNRTILAGQNTVLGGNPTAAGGTPGYTYLWNPAATLNDPALPNPIASPSATTSYTVTVTDTLGCSTTSLPIVITVTPVSRPVLTIAASPQGGWDISWPDSYTNQLVWSPTLGAGASWQPVATTPEVANGVKKVHLAPLPGNAFYGLQE